MFPDMDAPESSTKSDHIDSIGTLLVTANVGSLFEDPNRLLRPWLLTFLHKVEEQEPKFLALHLQEVGGKTYEKSMECVQEFLKQLCEAPEMQNFEIIRIFMDEDFNSAEHFTALGNLYFIHKQLRSVRLWNFFTHAWEVADGKQVYSGNIETIQSKEKSKFPQHFFPECKWSRKGFMRTRWEVNNTVFDLVNIHLFHDASNLAACEEFPSVYCKTRRRALLHTLDRFYLDEKNGLVPFYLFGDFNFRCDTEGVVKELAQNLTAHRVQSTKSENTKIHYRNSAGDNVLTVGKKEFNHADHQLKFKEPWLKKFDRELEPLQDFLYEFLIAFPPSYPYEEDPEMPTDYMSTRCPSWCDRILMSPQAKLIIDETISPDLYNIIGEHICMGDHKPVFLNICIKPNQGTYRCCNSHNVKTNQKSTTHNIPAVTIDMSEINDNSNQYCPHIKGMYNKFMSECAELKNELLNTGIYAEIRTMPFEYFHGVLSNIGNRNDNQVNKPVERGKNYNDNKNSNLDVTNTDISKRPLISIKLIDTDNIQVCMCSQILNDIGTNDAASSICPECQNIKKQSVEARYRIISKRLTLSNNIIVNRIDTHDLRTYLDFPQKRQDPYTPESADSHSPCPELNSSTTLTNSIVYSADNRQQFESECYTPDNHKLNVVTCENETNGKIRLVESVFNATCDENKNQLRTAVSPHLLKCRLEYLQNSSKLHPKHLDGSDSGVAGDSDVDKSRLSSNSPVQLHSNSCLPMCCSENSLARIPPEKLQKVINNTMGSEIVWREQCQMDVSALSELCISCKTRFVQIHSLTPNENSETSHNLANDSSGLLNLDAERDESDVFNKNLNNVQHLAILKETTV